MLVAAPYESRGGGRDTEHLTIQFEVLCKAEVLYCEKRYITARNTRVSPLTGETVYFVKCAAHGKLCSFSPVLHSFRVFTNVRNYVFAVKNAKNGPLGCCHLQYMFGIS